MGARLLQRISWRLACALFATVVSGVSITPTNSSTSVRYDGTINLRNNAGGNITLPSDHDAIITLVPLTSNATSANLNGELFYLADLNPATVPQGSIVYLTCDASDGYIGAGDILKSVYDSKTAQGAILFSTKSSYCNYTATDDSISGYAIYSMTNSTAAQYIREQVEAEGQSSKYFVRVTHSGPRDNQDGQQVQNNSQQNPLGPSPSTAVAMIILYSITGVITALFLVIIVTGAVRAHRHPDRYGPRDGTGRPARSRARGLGMAILDTIPIVKFGEREQPKPADVELGSTSEARGVDAADADTTMPAIPETRGDAPIEATRSAGVEQVDGLDSGIAPAQPVTVAAVTQTDSSTDEGLGCSICTDDFEKGQDIRVLPCNHKFHPECVDPWLLNVSGTCPLCRVDLRPTTSHTTSSTSGDPDALAPPLQSDTEASHRRHSTLRDVLSFRSRPNASADERISALRRLREHRRNQSGEAVEGTANASSDDVTTRDRRSKRMSVRLSDVFSGRRRGGLEDSPETGQPSSSAYQPPRREESPPRPNAPPEGSRTYARD